MYDIVSWNEKDNMFQIMVEEECLGGEGGWNVLS